MNSIKLCISKCFCGHQGRIRYGYQVTSVAALLLLWLRIAGKLVPVSKLVGFPDGSEVKNLPAMLETGVWSLDFWKIPQRRAQQPSPVFFPGEFHWQRSLAGYTVQKVAKSWMWLKCLSTHARTGKLVNSFLCYVSKSSGLWGPRRPGFEPWFSGGHWLWGSVKMGIIVIYTQSRVDVKLNMLIIHTHTHTHTHTYIYLHPSVCHTVGTQYCWLLLLYIEW